MLLTLPVTDQTLRSVYLFAGLTDQQLADLKGGMQGIGLQDGEYLFEYGQPANHFFVLLKGYIKLIRFSAEGAEKVFEIISPGESFAEAIMFMSKRTYPVTAQGIGTVEVLAFDNKVFLTILAASFDTCMRVMGNMSRRLRHWLNEIDQLTLQNATYRLVNYLLYQIPPEVQLGHCQIDFIVPKHVIASRLSITPETLSRILHHMTEIGLIAVKGRTIHIGDVRTLRLYGQH